MSGLTKTLSRSAYYLDDYVELLEATVDMEDIEALGVVDMCHEMRQLSERLKQLMSDWDQRRAFSSHADAANILCAMLDDWKFPGAVWYWPKSKRFRLTGADYKPNRDEILCGVYLPGVTPEAMAEDLEATISEEYAREETILWVCQ